MQGAQGFKPPKIPGYQAVNNWTPQQLQLFQNMFSQVSPESYTSRLAGGDQSLFQEMEQPAMRQFGELQGNIASRFSQGGGGPGAMSSRRSSGFQNTMNQASSNFAQDLQSRRQDLQRQAISDLTGMSSELLGQNPYSYMPKKSSFWEQLMGNLSGGAGQALGNYGSMYGMNKMGFMGS
jgi:hypothetical protein